MAGRRPWRRILMRTAVVLIVLTLGGWWFVARVAAPRLGSQAEMEGLAAPPDFDPHDLRHVERLMATLADALAARPLNAGIAIGITQHGVRRTVARGVLSRSDPAGKVNDSTLFEVGSVAKTFTGVALAGAVVNGTVTLDQPIATLLPDGSSLSPVGQSITLGALATHTAGLPADPPSVSFLSRTFARHPFGSVSDSTAFASLARVTADLPAEAVGTYAYSNFGFMLLGRLLELATGRDYAALVEAGVAARLGMHDTWVEPPEAVLTRLSTGHRVGHPVEHWYAYELPGAAGLVSTAPDLLTYLEALLRPDATPIPDALTLAITPRARASDTVAVGLGWHVYQAGDGPIVIYHNGSTMGFRSYVGMAPSFGLGIVVLGNSRDPSINAIGRLLMRSLTSTPVTSQAGGAGARGSCP